VLAGGVHIDIANVDRHATDRQQVGGGGEEGGGRGRLPVGDDNVRPYGGGGQGGGVVENVAHFVQPHRGDRA